MRRRSYGRCFAALLLARAATGAGRLAELLLVVRAGRSAADVDQHRRARSGRHRARPHRHPGQRHRHASSTCGRAARTPAAARSRRTSSTAATEHQVADVRAAPAGSSSSSPSRSTVVDYALTSANDAAGARPAGLDAPGLRRRHGPGRRSTPGPARTSPSASRPSRTTFANDDRLPATTGSTSPRNHGDGIIQLAELQLSNGDDDPAARRRHAQPWSAAARAAATPPRPAPASPACARCGTPARHTADGRALLLQQGLRRRHAGHAATPSCPTGSSRVRCDDDLRLPEHVRGRRPRASPTAPT